MRTECACNKEGIVVNGEEVEDIDEFVFLGAIVNKEGGGCKDVGNRLKKEEGKVWAAKGTNISQFKTYVRPILLYGCEAWKITKDDQKH